MGALSSPFSFQVSLAAENVAQAIEPPGNIPGQENPQVASVAIKAKMTNTGLLFIGKVGVTALTGFELEKGETITLDIQNTGSLYFVGPHVGDTLCVLGVGP